MIVRPERSEKAQSASDKKYRLADFSDNKPESKADTFWRELETDGFLSGRKFDYLMEIEDARKEYGFDVDTSYAIADVAEQLEIPVGLLLRECFQLMAEVHSDLNYIPPDVEAAIDAGAESTEEMEKICEFFQCKYYDVDSFMVEAYRKRSEKDN